MSSSYFYTHSYYEKYIASWTKLRDFSEGEDAVKAAGITYLPKLDSQSDTEYEAYKSRATFFAGTARTIDALIGLMMRKSPKISLPKEVEGKTDNVTLNGQPLSVLFSTAAREQFTTGRYGVLVDMSRSGERAYMVGYTAEQIVNWKTTIDEEKGVEYLSTVVLREVPETDFPLIVTDPSSDPSYYQYRILELVDGIYRQRVVREQMIETSKGYRRGQNKMVLIEVPESNVTPTVRGEPLDFIPFQFFGQEDLSPDIGKPPLLNLVNMNKSHYLSSADLEQGRHYTALPVYVISDSSTQADVKEDKTQSLKVGGSDIWLLSDTGSATILEYQGSGLSSLENAVDHKEKLMAILGAKLLDTLSKSAAESTDAIKLRETAERSVLAVTATMLSLAFTKVIKWWTAFSTGKLEYIDDQDIKIVFNRDFTETKMSSRDMLALLKVYQAGELPLDIFLETLIEGEILSSDLQIEDIKELYKKPDQMPVITVDKGGILPNAYLQPNYEERVQNERMYSGLPPKYEENTQQNVSQVEAQAPQEAQGAPRISS